MNIKRFFSSAHASLLALIILFTLGCTMECPPDAAIKKIQDELAAEIARIDATLEVNKKNENNKHEEAKAKINLAERMAKVNLFGQYLQKKINGTEYQRGLDRISKDYESRRQAELDRHTKALKDFEDTAKWGKDSATTNAQAAIKALMDQCAEQEE